MRNQYVQGSYTPQSSWGSGSRRPGQAWMLRSRHLLTYGIGGLVPLPQGRHENRERISKRSGGWGTGLSAQRTRLSRSHTLGEAPGGQHRLPAPLLQLLAGAQDQSFPSLPLASSAGVAGTFLPP